MKFELTWYPKSADDFAGEVDLDVTEGEVRRAFGLAAGEYPGDCLEVSQDHVAWLAAVSNLAIDLGQYDYSVCVFATTQA
jgi:hypothetical protein